MNWLDYKKKFEPSKNWIISNQSSSGAIFWDEKGKCDPWDHCECLIALAIYEEWEHFWRGVNWFFTNLNEDGLIYAEFQNEKPSKLHYESHHAPYIIMPLIQASLIDKEQDYKKILTNEQLLKLENIFEVLDDFKDEDGYFYWAKDSNGYSDNSLITASMSIFLSLVAKDKSFPKFNTEMWQEKFNRDGVDRSRFSMDFYYPFLAGIKNNKKEFLDLLDNYYEKGLGVKCVAEEPWVTIAESSECVISALIHDNENIAKQIFNDIQQFQNKDGIFPTGYQYDMEIFWPEENSTWTNAAVIIAAHALSFYDLGS
ncbi:MAG: hypothetical protein EB063_02755, partial [Proteobacteria bacterium]|nr:hypothetical protein [Pseudomonadota bacterium]